MKGIEVLRCIMKLAIVSHLLMSMESAYGILHRYSREIPVAVPKSDQN